MPSLTRVLSRLAALLLACLLLAALGSSPAHAAAEQPVQLSAKAVDQEGTYFDLTLEPGQRRQLEIELGNTGAEPITARTYAADAYTIINGGFGAALRDAEPTGTTTWLDHPTQVLTLDPGRAVVQAFTVAVPTGTPPGEYLTSIVLENETAVAGSGSVALNQIVRQVIAVAVKVPGPLTPGLAIATASHTVAGEHSMVAVEVSNPGNLRLTPNAELTVHDVSGALVAEQGLTMDSFYAGTTTKVEIALAKLLLPGNYTVNLVLTDAERGASATATNLAFSVAEAEVPAAPTGSSVRQRFAEVLQTATGGLPVPMLLTGFVMSLVLIASGALWWRRHRGAAPSPRGRHASTTRRSSNADLLLTR